VGAVHVKHVHRPVQGAERDRGARRDRLRRHGAGTAPRRAGETPKPSPRPGQRHPSRSAPGALAGATVASSIITVPKGSRGAPITGASALRPGGGCIAEMSYPHGNILPHRPAAIARQIIAAAPRPARSGQAIGVTQPLLEAGGIRRLALQ
jgi:hypothetical protein